MKILAALLVNIMFGLEEVVTKKTMRIDVQGRDIENLLYSWLEKILLLVLVDEFIPSEFDAKYYYGEKQHIANRYCQR